MVAKLAPLRKFTLNYIELLNDAETAPQLHRKQFRKFEKEIALLAYAKDVRHRQLAAGYRDLVELLLSDAQRITASKLRLDLYQRLDATDKLVSFRKRRIDDGKEKLDESGAPLTNENGEPLDYSEMLEVYESIRKERYDELAKKLAPQDFERETAGNEDSTENIEERGKDD